VVVQLLLPIKLRFIIAKWIMQVQIIVNVLKYGVKLDILLIFSLVELVQQMLKVYILELLLMVL
jgi:hypothetical protein